MKCAVSLRVYLEDINATTGGRSIIYDHWRPYCFKMVFTNINKALLPSGPPKTSATMSFYNFCSKLPFKCFLFYFIVMRNAVDRAINKPANQFTRPISYLVIQYISTNE